MSRYRSNIALIGNPDAGLIAAIRQIVSSISGCDLTVCPASSLSAIRVCSIALYYACENRSVAKAIEMTEQIIYAFPAAPVIVISGHQSDSNRECFITRGAADYLQLPLDASRLSLLLDLFTSRHRAMPQAPACGAQETEDMPTTSPEMMQVMEQIRRVASLPVTLLLTGETGSGKTHLARCVHRIGLSPQAPFLTVDCGAMPETLMESELFGHARGAFTGAHAQHKGKLEVVRAGTLLLDEVDALTWEMQTRLLRVVEDREFEPLGSNTTKSFRGRLIVATNQDLEKAVIEKRFREDLYYRLNVINLAIPPLRERPADIPDIANAFLDRYATEYRGRQLRLSKAAVEALKAYSWPGNVRELRNVIERACALSKSDLMIDLRDLPAPLQLRSHSKNGAKEGHQNQLAVARGEAERRRIEEAIRRHANNRSRAADDLGISRVTLYKKLRKFGLM